MTHCELFQADEIQVIIGDDSRGGVTGPEYCGIWSLTSKHRPFNAFGNSFAGLIPSELRRKSPTFEVLDETSCALRREADEAYPVDARATFQVRGPYYIDHTLTFTDREDVRVLSTHQGHDRSRANFREVAWCCYMNCPDDPRLHFLSGDRWFRYISPRHGYGASIAPAYVPDDELEVWTERIDRGGGRMAPFHWDRIKERFDQPLYYGRLGNMALILIFDTPRWLRFFCSPGDRAGDGGGKSLVPGKACPAWDFEWVIPDSDYELNREYNLRMRMVYKRFVSDDDVLEEYRKAQQELGFETV